MWEGSSKWSSNYTLTLLKIKQITDWWSLCKFHHLTEETSKNCFGSKKHNMILRQRKQVSRSVTVKQQCTYLCLPRAYSFSPDEMVVLSFSDPKQLLRVSCFRWCNFIKWSLNIFGNASLWCFTVVRQITY